MVLNLDGLCYLSNTEIVAMSIVSVITDRCYRKTSIASAAYDWVLSRAVEILAQTIEFMASYLYFSTDDWVLSPAIYILSTKGSP